MFGLFKEIPCDTCDNKNLTKYISCDTCDNYSNYRKATEAELNELMISNEEKRN